MMTGACNAAKHDRVIAVDHLGNVVDGVLRQAVDAKEVPGVVAMAATDMITISIEVVMRISFDFSKTHLNGAILEAFVALAQQRAHNLPYGSLTSYTDEPDVAALAKEGREPAFRELVRRYERPVFSLIFRMVRDREMAEDLAQDTFIKVLNNIDRYRPEFKFSSWIFKIGNNALQ